MIYPRKKLYIKKVGGERYGCSDCSYCCSCDWCWGTYNQKKKRKLKQRKQVIKIIYIKKQKALLRKLHLG